MLGALATLVVVTALVWWIFVHGAGTQRSEGGPRDGLVLSAKQPLSSSRVPPTPERREWDALVPAAEADPPTHLDVRSYPSDGTAPSEELEWMWEHGYPTLEQWDRLGSMPVELLRDIAGRGDVVAMALLASRLMSTGEPQALEEAGNWLVEARTIGSTFAASLLGDWTLLRSNGQGDMTTRYIAATEYAAAILMGDYAARDRFGDVLGPNPASIHVEAIVVGAADWLGRLNAERAARGMPPYTPTPRPPKPPEG